VEALVNNGAAGTPKHRSWSALRANLKQELFAPVEALCKYGDWLLSEAEEREYEILLDDLRTLRTACGRV